MVEFPSTTATDLSGTVIFKGASHASGSEFRVGVTTVTYTYADESDNSASCTFTVLINEGIFH